MSRFHVVGALRVSTIFSIKKLQIRVAAGVDLCLLHVYLQTNVHLFEVSTFSSTFCASLKANEAFCRVSILSQRFCEKDFLS